MNRDSQLVITLKERCRVCYTCVRDCPAKAIRITGGQAQVISERCIGCGNCIKVCSQNAKQAYNLIDDIIALLESGNPVAAIVAPSFPADFPDVDYKELVGMIKQIGFSLVCEVSAGADLVAEAYKNMLENDPDERRIATTCPAVVSYIEKYHPDLVHYLAPIVSPMAATARLLHAQHGPDLRIVFIGPCIAKKAEAVRPENEDELDAVLTFIELQKLFESYNISPVESERQDFDPPHPGLGTLFPISRGMLQASGLKEDLISNHVVAADGKNEFIQAIKEFDEGTLDVKLLEVLCCDGCIMGPGMRTEAPLFTRRTAVSQYARQRLESSDPDAEKPQEIDLSISFTMDDRRIPLPSKAEIEEVLKRMGKHRPEDELDCGACGYDTCREHAIAILKGLAESEMCLPYTIDRLKSSLEELNISNEQLATTQQALVNSEKLASMGQLSAGIAHEINNPLGVILLYSKLLMDEAGEDPQRQEDLKMIVEQAERCKTIVSGLLNFARKNKVHLRPANLPDLVDHCLKAITVPGTIRIQTSHNMEEPYCLIDPDQIAQVMTNLTKNAVEAMPEGGTIKIATSTDAMNAILVIEDDGTGIPEEIIKKIFEPLFTTKQIGKGTGLGLAVTYGIIKMHRGTIDVTSNADPSKGKTGTRFTVTIPRDHKNGNREERERIPGSSLIH